VAGNPNQRILRESIAHQTGLLRFGVKVGRDAVDTLSAADDELLAFLGRRLRDLLRATPAVQAELRTALGVSVGEINAAAYEDVHVSILTDMHDLLRYEAEFQSGMLSRATGADFAVELDAATREAILNAPIMGRSIAEQLDDAAAARLLKIQKAVGDATSTGLDANDALKLIEGTTDEQYRDGAMQAARDWLETLGITDTSGVADAAGREVYRESGAVRGELWCSVLDSQTTPVCRANDGAMRKLGEREWKLVGGGTYSGPYPAHYGERSVIVPQLKGAEPVDKLTYAEWLNGESEATQRDVLGETRWRLWKDGRLPLGRFVTDRGRPLTIDELRANERAAFKRAGIEEAA
jgi:hypothetical protein